MAVHEHATKAPLYWQLASTLRGRIAEGEYPAGAQLPTEGALCQEFGVSRITVRGALDRLTVEGLLRRERGRGTFVAAPPVGRDPDAAGPRATAVVTHLAEEGASEAIGGELALPTGTPIVRVERVRLAAGQPLAFDRTFLSLRYGRLLDRAALATETIRQQLAARDGAAIRRGRFQIEALNAPTDLAARLGVAPGAALLLLHRTSFADDGGIIAYQRRYYRGDRVRYQLDRQRLDPRAQAHPAIMHPDEPAVRAPAPHRADLAGRV
jgi:GntR family transcriptional regulator